MELQRQVLDAMNYVLYEQLKYKGNEGDYYNSLNSYIRQVSRSLLNKSSPPKKSLSFDSFSYINAQHMSAWGKALKRQIAVTCSVFTFCIFTSGVLRLLWFYVLKNRVVFCTA